ncbi:MAG: TIR domain-containing protein [Myxococcales bacterium]|nr:TIR domain-containing protein [Myxococcales bacterium]
MRLTHELCRQLLGKKRVADASATDITEASPQPVTLFLSHAKRDGEETARSLRDYIQTTLPLKTFFDTLDIAPGFSFKNEIDAGIERSALLVIQTDAYSSREWCQHEIMWAKRRRRPVVVVHAISRGEKRSFPYAGNVPTRRWDPSRPDECERVVGDVLHEVLRFEYFRQHFETLRSLYDVPKDAHVTPCPPEAPHGAAHALGEVAAATRRLPGPAARRRGAPASSATRTRHDHDDAHSSRRGAPMSSTVSTPLSGLRLGISISSSPDLARLGLGEVHLQDAFVEMTRYLLASGGSPAYGGDLRKGGYTDLLLDLLRTYRDELPEVPGTIHNYLAWPLSLKLDPGFRAMNKQLAVFHEIAPPDDITVDTSTFLPPDSAKHRAVWARCLTTMRETMTRETDARVLLGGPVRGFLGRYPGLLEEALLALRSSKPLFLVGGFGGCTQSIIEALTGAAAAAFQQSFQEQDPAYVELMAEFNRAVDAKELRSDRIDWTRCVDELRGYGVSGLKNGLTDEENQLLFRSVHTQEIVALVLRGLGHLRASSTGGK